MKVLILPFLLLCFLPGLAQRIDLDTIQLFQDIQALSADSMEGRRSGTIGNRKAQQYLESRFKSIGLKPFGNSYRQHFRLQHKQEVVEQAANIIGYIPGKTDKAIVVTAHYDHLGQRNGNIFNGADDNASGVSALLAVAAYFQRQKPEHTLIFAALDGEELGLQGASAFLNNPPVALSKILLNVNLDMLSINNKGELYASGTYHNPWLAPYLQQVEPLANAKLMLGHDQPEQGQHDWTNQSDHYQFYKRQIPFVYFGVEDHPHYHKATDTFAQINRPFYADATTLVLNFLQLFDQSYKPASNYTD
ncbi:M28 family peptidase [Pontibacter sp. 13R65]|uniref:M28 family peptidase n=1 Tax=Pontibacter sp. 13R65 TaxID=3127458 RepID=UPI00301DF50C